MKIVLDTNGLIQAVSRKGEFYEVWRNFLERKYTLCVTTEIITEYEEILKQRLDNVDVAENILIQIETAPNTEYVQVYYSFNLINEDPDDNKFVNCAVSANATYIVTNDKHFNILKKIPFPKLVLKTMAEFKKILQKL